MYQTQEWRPECLFWITMIWEQAVVTEKIKIYWSLYNSYKLSTISKKREHFWYHIQISFGKYNTDTMSNENENEYTKGYIDLIFGYLGFCHKCVHCWRWIYRKISWKERWTMILYLLVTLLAWCKMKGKDF